MGTQFRKWGADVRTLGRLLPLACLAVACLSLWLPGPRFIQRLLFQVRRVCLELLVSERDFLFTSGRCPSEQMQREQRSAWGGRILNMRISEQSGCVT